MIQPQPVESTQETIRTPSAYMKPTPTTIAGDIVQKKRKRKQTAGETSSLKPSLKIRIGSHKEHLKMVDDDDENEKEKKDDDNDDDFNDDHIDQTLDKT
ncbi:hypothetical protein Tco_1191435 [Tanacetum coccineum]